MLHRRQRHLALLVVAPLLHLSMTTICHQDFVATMPTPNQTLQATTAQPKQPTSDNLGKGFERQRKGQTVGQRIRAIARVASRLLWDQDVGTTSIHNDAPILGTGGGGVGSDCSTVWPPLDAPESTVF